MRILIVLMALWASNVMALDFKGVTMGKVPTEAQLAGVTGAIQLEGMNVDSTAELDKDGNVISIEVQFEAFHFNLLKVLATQKWGKPTSSVKLVMQNGFGA